MSSNDEMLEAIGLATQAVPAVLRLTVKTKVGAAPAPPTPPQDGVNELMQKISAQLPHLVHQLPEALRRLVPNAEVDLAATVAANINSAMTAGAHPGVTCDKTGMCPIIGNRWNLAGHDYDLCEAEYQKLSEEEKTKFVLIPPPGAPPLAAGFGLGGCAPPGDFHPGVSCDKSGVCPIVGFRYHLRGHNYDLCEAEFQKLSPKEQANFEKIAPPPKPKPFGGGGGGGGPKLAARFVRDVSIFDGTQMAPGTAFTKIW